MPSENEEDVSASTDEMFGENWTFVRQQRNFNSVLRQIDAEPRSEVTAAVHAGSLNELLNMHM